MLFARQHQSIYYLNKKKIDLNLLGLFKYNFTRE